MSGKTGIEWTDAVWNPVTGCTKVSAGCKNCYAERDFHRPYPGRDFTDVRCHPERLDWPLHRRKPLRIFVNSMSDLFHEQVSSEFIDQVLIVMASARRHTFQILTKRANRMLECLHNPAMGGYIWDLANRKHGPFMGDLWPLPNVWLGVSVEDQKTADERVPLLLQTPAAVRFVSYEPALGLVDFERGGFSLLSPCKSPTGKSWPGLDWVIAGGESGPGARPSHPDWFRSVRDQCQAAGVPFFMKQITEKGRKIPFDQWPEDLRIRQFPGV